MGILQVYSIKDLKKFLIKAFIILQLDPIISLKGKMYSIQQDIVFYLTMIFLIKIKSILLKIHLMNSIVVQMQIYHMIKQLDGLVLVA